MIRYIQNSNICFVLHFLKLSFNFHNSELTDVPKTESIHSSIKQFVKMSDINLKYLRHIGGKNRKSNSEYYFESERVSHSKLLLCLHVIIVLCIPPTLNLILSQFFY